jgi:hypothetical protein
MNIANAYFCLSINHGNGDRILLDLNIDKILHDIFPLTFLRIFDLRIRGFLSLLFPLPIYRCLFRFHGNIVLPTIRQDIGEVGASRGRT